MEQNVNSLVKALKDFEDIYFQIKDNEIDFSEDEDQPDSIEEDEFQMGDIDERERQKKFDPYEQHNYADATHYSPLADDWVSKEEYISDCQEIISEFLNLLIELRDNIRFGNIKIFNNKLIEAKERLDSDFLSGLLYKKTGKDSDDISNVLFSITENINFDEFFENEILALPQNITELTEEIIFQISQTPELLYSLNPRLFEELVQRIFVKFKLRATLTKHSRDGGFDVVAFEDTQFSRSNYIIECKRYSRQKKVSIDVVQRLYGVKQSNRMTKAFLVTSSTFTKPAIEWAKQHCWELELKDYDDISKWLKTFWKR